MLNSRSDNQPNFSILSVRFLYKLEIRKSGMLGFFLNNNVVAHDKNYSCLISKEQIEKVYYSIKDIIEKAKADSCKVKICQIGVTGTLNNSHLNKAFYSVEAFELFLEQNDLMRVVKQSKGMT